MPRQSALLKYDRVNPDILMDGCGDCQSCEAKQVCEGCNLCALANCSKTTCSECSVRCWAHKHLKPWFQDINSLDLNTHKCHKTFSEDLPLYIPQIQNNAFGCSYPAYIINIHRLLNHRTSHWCYRKKGIKYHFHIPQTAKLLLSFCSADHLLEPIWTRSDNWVNGESFWDGLAAYLHPLGIDASFSVEFSCFADAPRMDHLINIKRNIISAHEISLRNIPIILDATIRTDKDLDRMLEWSNKFNVAWYVLNFQRTKPVPWLIDLIKNRINRIIAKNGNNVIVSGLGDIDQMRDLRQKYGSRVVFTNTVVSMKTNFYRELKHNKWIKSAMLQDELFAHNLTTYCSRLES